MEFDRGELGCEKCKGEVLKFEKPSASEPGAERCVEISEWLLMEVLIRLPVKLVFSFKLVCKQWLSVISDPYFIGMYVSRASSSPQLQIWTSIYSVMHVDGNPKYELLEDAYSCHLDLKFPSFFMLRCPFLMHPSMRHYDIVGVSNGLVLYVPVQGNKIYNIYNPITGQRISLRPYTRYFYMDKCCLVTRVENGVLSSYRVVRLDKNVHQSNMIRFEVFVSETSEWKGFDMHMDQAVGFTWRNPTTLNGVIHWVTHHHGIMAFDPYKKPNSLRFIALPRDTDQTPLRQSNGMPRLCDANQGCLRFFEMSGFFEPPHGFSSFSVWILNDYCRDDWCLQHRISPADIVYDDFLSGKRLYLEPIFFHPFDSEIVYLGYQDIIVSYNIKTRKLEAHDITYAGYTKMEVDDLFSAGRCPYLCSETNFLFVIPPWPVSMTPSSVV